MFSKTLDESHVAHLLLVFDIQIVTVNNGVSEWSFGRGTSAKGVPQSVSKVGSSGVRSEAVRSHGTAQRDEHLLPRLWHFLMSAAMAGQLARPPAKLSLQPEMVRVRSPLPLNELRNETT